MQYNRDKKVYRMANDKYSGNITMLAIYDAQSKELDRTSALIYQTFLNNFIKYCDVEGVRRFEALFDINANEETETLEFRKERVRQKFNQLPPFTRIYVEQMLEYVFGTGNWEFIPDYNNYRVQIGIETNIEGLVNETIKDLRKIIPANIILQLITYEEYQHNYLKRHYTHYDLQQFTQWELSQYA